MNESSLVQNISLLNKLPKTWFIKDFSDVLSDNSGGNKKLAKTEFLESGDIAIVDQGKELIAGYYDNMNFAVKTPPPYIVFGDHTRIFKYIDFPFVMGADGTKVLQPKDNNYNTKYLYYFFLSINIPETGYNRHFKYLKELQIPLPPLEQQKKIAAILDAADAYRQKTKALIAKYDELTQSLFLDMFGDPVIKQKKIQFVKLSEVVDRNKIITYGIVQAGENLKNGVPYIRTGDIKNGKILIEKLQKTSQEIAKSYERSKCAAGDIVMSIRATVGTIAIVPPELDGVNLTQGTARISPDTKIIDRYFLYYCLKSKDVQLKIEKQTKGATFREITLGRLREIEIPLPSINSQNQFAERVQAIEKQKAQAQASLEKAEELFASLLQKSFKGDLV